MAGTSKATSEEGQRINDPFRLKAIAELFKHGKPPDRFLAELLAIQCRAANADAAALMRMDKKERLEILASHPHPVVNGTPIDWVVQVEKFLRRVMASGKSVIEPQAFGREGRASPSRHLIVIPILNDMGVRAVAAFQVEATHPHTLPVSHALLETTPLLLDHFELHQALKARHGGVNRLSRVLDVLSVVNRPSRFLGAAMALCNEIATQFDCSRVSLGNLKGRDVHVQAMSHTDTFTRKMKLVQAIEAAMEECLDQDVEVIYPATDGAMVVSRATAALAHNHGPASVLSLPIRDDDGASAVITLERTLERPFVRLEEVEAVRLIGDLCAPRLFDLRKNDRWVGARLASWVRKAIGLLLGHQYTWIKVGSCLAFLMAVWLSTAQGDYRIEAAFRLEAQNRHVVVAPFDSYFKSVLVEPGDQAEGGQTILGTLETSELRLQLAALKAERLGYQKQMTAAMSDQKTADAQIARAQSDKLSAEIRLIENKIVQATLVAPISGRIVSEDRKQQIGAPVETGAILFEIARISALRAVLYVPESSIASVAVDQTGELASEGHPDQRIAFVVERVNPIAEVVNHNNVFRVRVRIVEQLEWMRPGMEGRARIYAGKRSFFWIASHRPVDWLRMKLWI